MFQHNANAYMIRRVNLNIRKLNYIYYRNNRTSQNRKQLKTIPQASMGIVEYSEIIGKGLILFVFFTSSLNWLHYRNLRQQMDDENEKGNKNNKNNK